MTEEEGRLLARIDERGAHFGKQLDTIESHLTNINGSLKDHASCIAENGKDIAVAQNDINHHKKIINGIIAFTISVILLLVGIWLKGGIN